MTEVKVQKSKSSNSNEKDNTRKNFKKSISFKLFEHTDNQEEIKEFLKSLLNASSHFGDVNVNANVKKKDIVITKKNGCSIINLNKIIHYLQNALDMICNIIANDGKILFFFPENNEIGNILKTTAMECDQFYIIEGWDPGSFTNFGEILKKHHKVQNVSNIYFANKKERSVFEKKIERTKKYVAGITNMYDLPSAVITVIHPKSTVLLKEARSMKIPVLGFMDVNENIDNISHPVPINTKSIKTIELLCHLIKKSILQGYETALRNKTNTDKQAEVIKQTTQNIEEKMIDEVLKETSNT